MRSPSKIGPAILVKTLSYSRPHGAPRVMEAGTRIVVETSYGGPSHGLVFCYEGRWFRVKPSDFKLLK